MLFIYALINTFSPGDIIYIFLDIAEYSFPYFLKVLALVFVRKLMDLCFTKRELSWLDDLMPESKKKKEDDKKKKEKEVKKKEFQMYTIHLLFNIVYQVVNTIIVTSVGINSFSPPKNLIIKKCSVARSCPTLCNPVDCSTPGLPVHHHLPEFTQTHLH